MPGTKSFSTISLITVPALLTLAITIVRLVGELKHWPAPWFSNAAGGGGALIGISWLPILFGPYFAVKLAGAGDRWASAGRTFLSIAIGIVCFVGGGFLVESMFNRLGKPGAGLLMLVGFALMLAAAFIARSGWRALVNVLFAYAFAARIPVLIVMLVAMIGKWGTHYDAIAPALANASFIQKFVYEALLPQMTMWIGYTVLLGSLTGAIAALFVHQKSSSVAQQTA